MNQRKGIIKQRKEKEGKMTLKKGPIGNLAALGSKPQALTLEQLKKTTKKKHRNLRKNSNLRSTLKYFNISKTLLHEFILGLKNSPFRLGGRGAKFKTVLRLLTRFNPISPCSPLITGSVNKYIVKPFIAQGLFICDINITHLNGLSKMEMEEFPLGRNRLQQAFL